MPTKETESIDKLQFRIPGIFNIIHTGSYCFTCVSCSCKQTTVTRETLQKFKKKSNNTNIWQLWVLSPPISFYSLEVYYFKPQICEKPWCFKTSFLLYVWFLFEFFSFCASIILYCVIYRVISAKIYWPFFAGSEVLWRDIFKMLNWAKTCL